MRQKHGVRGMNAAKTRCAGHGCGKNKVCGAWMWQKQGVWGMDVAEIRRAGHERDRNKVCGHESAINTARGA